MTIGKATGPDYEIAGSILLLQPSQKRISFLLRNRNKIVRTGEAGRARSCAVGTLWKELETDPKRRDCKRQLIDYALANPDTVGETNWGGGWDAPAILFVTGDNFLLRVPLLGSGTSAMLPRLYA